MKKTLLHSYLSIFTFWECIFMARSQPSSKKQEEQTLLQRHIDCQQRSSREYAGEVNITADGIPCQRWSATEPHNHSFTHVGDHNFCRNPDGNHKVWCYTTDPKYPAQYCSVPFCPPSKEETRRIGCQQRSTFGRDYMGEANITVDGIP